ncbi:MAG: adenylate/guanylate cyclase domain-containing protein [Gammaproteobacteria bacterium]
MRRYLIRLGTSLVIIAALVAHVWGTIEIPFVNQFERILYDARVRATAPGGVDEDIVIIAIDERSLEVEGQFPWTRDKLALLVTQLYDYGVEMIGWDVVFPERDLSHNLEMLRELGAGDPAFIAQLERFAPQLERDVLFGEALGLGKSVLAYYFHTDERANFTTGELPIPAFEFDESMQESIFLPRASGYSSNPPEISAGAWSAGFISNPLIDPDGIVRRTPLLHEYDHAAYESLSLAMAAAHLDDIALPVFVDQILPGYPPLEAIEVAGRRIPVDAQGAVLVPYRGGAGSFEYVPAWEVTRGQVERPELLEGAIAIIGATAPGLQDLRSTPFGSIYPGVEIHANVLRGILDGDFRWQPAYSRAAEVLSVAAFGLLMALLLPALSAVWATLLMLMTATGFVLFNMYLWNEQSHVLPMAATIDVILAVFVVNMIYGYFFESRSRTYMNDLFGQYVPPDLVKDMAHDPTNYSMESEKRELSVLFTDIRGFTTISEKLDAQELSDLLNRFLTPMTQAVHDTHGTIDKYMGDCVMAFWGAPVHDDEHAVNAIHAGMRMLAELDVLNEAFEKENFPEIKIGVGINTGSMSVGNMGSRFRRAYTVLGDAVNLGSRLEGLTKAYGVYLLVSEFTREAAPGFVYRPIDLVRVKGKNEPVAIFDVLGEEKDVPGEAKARALQHEQALKLYRHQAWDEAERIWRDLLEHEPDCLLYQIYLDRLATFRENPPGEDWDGVFTFETK